MSQTLHNRISVIGGGPAGLMAAEAAVSQGLPVDLFDAMPSVGRKFLLAGKGGLNLTHAEPFEQFMTRYGSQSARLEPLIREFGPLEICRWAQGLGIDTFVGSSQRIFPLGMKAAPLLRAWIRRLKEKGVKFHPRHRWVGWTSTGELMLVSPSGELRVLTEALVLALGGASWPHLGSDAQWVDVLTRREIPVTPLEASNSGFRRDWSPTFSDRFAGTPIKTIEARITKLRDRASIRGEIMVTKQGLEGGLIYALSSAIRECIKQEGHADLLVDLAPDRSQERLEDDWNSKRGKSSMSTHLRKHVGLSEVKIGLLREVSQPLMPALIKNLPIRLYESFPVDKAISTAGGVSLDALNEGMMITNQPGLFVAGEMLDWDAPTGGYLLTASLATGRKAGLAAAQWAKRHPHSKD